MQKKRFICESDFLMKFSLKIFFKNEKNLEYNKLKIQVIRHNCSENFPD